MLHMGETQSATSGRDIFRIYIYVCMDINECTNIFLRLFVYKNMCTFVHIYLSMLMYMKIFIYIYIYIYVYIYHF
jgi:hypothetical protein